MNTQIESIKRNYPVSLRPLELFTKTEIEVCQQEIIRILSLFPVEIIDDFIETLKNGGVNGWFHKKDLWGTLIKIHNMRNYLGPYNHLGGKEGKITPLDKEFYSQREDFYTKNRGNIATLEKGGSIESDRVLNLWMKQICGVPIRPIRHKRIESEIEEEEMGNIQRNPFCKFTKWTVEWCYAARRIKSKIKNN